MAKKKPTRKAVPSKPPKGRGGGGAKKKSFACDTMDSETEKIRQLRSRIAELEGHVAELAMGSEGLKVELQLEKMRTAELTKGRTEMEDALRRARKFPDDMHAMSDFLHRAPSFWHFHTLLEVMLQRLSTRTKLRDDEQKDAALKALAEMARKFRMTPSKDRAAWLDSALKEPAFLEVWNRLPPKRTRGGTGDLRSPQVVFTFVELTMLQFERSHASHILGPSRAEMYSKPNEYLEAFMPYAKAEWEEGGREGVEGLWKEKGYKLRANNGNAAQLKQSFGLFKPEIEENVRRNLKKWRGAYPP
jgi:hypothetical protein